MRKKPLLHLLELKDVFILQQLQWEEALLRLDKRNWCLINQGSSPAVVMGISGQPSQLINLEKMILSPLPLIRRFSGGGTVVIDEQTLFITFICQAKEVEIAPFPLAIMQWSADFYSSLFPPSIFALKENDYTTKGRKWGGNAQLITKERWLHHTSILWDYQKEKMDYLLYPPKTPLYRGSRSHEEFICRLRDYWTTSEEFQKQWLKEVSQEFEIVKGSLEEVKKIALSPHRKATNLVI